jgi:TPR repeat protein
MEKGHIDAKDLYGTMLAEGIGIDPNATITLELFREVGGADISRGMMACGRVCITGQGTEVEWLRRAIDAGESEAHVIYANLIASGKGVP